METQQSSDQTTELEYQAKDDAMLANLFPRIERNAKKFKKQRKKNKGTSCAWKGCLRGEKIGRRDREVYL